MEQFLTLFNHYDLVKILITGVFAGALLGLLGIFVVLRNLAFFSDGLAHTALAGLAVGVVLNQEPLYWAIIFSVIFATLIYFLEKKTTILPDALIGILFTSALALGVILLHFKTGGEPESLEGLLFGDISHLTDQDVWLTVILAIVGGVFILSQFKKYIFLSLNKELAYLAGLKTELYQYLLYLALAIAIILGIKLLGVILVSALVIVPVATAKLFARSARGLLWLTLLFAELAVLLGLIISYGTALPAGAVIILTGAVIFGLGLALTLLLKK